MACAGLSVWWAFWHSASRNAQEDGEDNGIDGVHPVWARLGAVPPRHDEDAADDAGHDQALGRPGVHDDLHGAQGVRGGATAAARAVEPNSPWPVCASAGSLGLCSTGTAPPLQWGRSQGPHFPLCPLHRPPSACPAAEGGQRDQTPQRLALVSPRRCPAC